MKLQKNPSLENYYITIPNNLRKAKGWQKGEELEWEVQDDGSLKLYSP